MMDRVRGYTTIRLEIFTNDLMHKLDEAISIGGLDDFMSFALEVMERAAAVKRQYEEEV